MSTTGDHRPTPTRRTNRDNPQRDRSGHRSRRRTIILVVGIVLVALYVFALIGGGGHSSNNTTQSLAPTVRAIVPSG